MNTLLPGIFLFDLDGTIIDSAPGIIASFKHTIESMHLSVPEGLELKTLVGPPLDQTFRTRFSLDEKTALEAVRTYREFYREHAIHDHSLYPGIREMLTQLKQANKKIAIATSKPSVFAEDIIRYFQLDEVFDYVQGSNMDNTKSKKAEVIQEAMKQFHAPADTYLMIGDRKEDLVGAHANNIPFCGALYGYGIGNELEDSEWTVSDPFGITEQFL